MPTFYYVNDKGDKKTMVVPFAQRDKQEGWTRVESYPSEIRTEANSVSHVDGRASRDPKWAKLKQINKLNMAMGGARDEKIKEIKKEIKELQEDSYT